MSHALNILDHAIRGDPSGLSFLEQTASIYVLDAATNPGRPTTYGWWNFLNDALNDVERYESEAAGRQQLYGAENNSLDGHVRLLATITRRVARRPPSSDRRLVGTCLANASMSHMNLMGNPDLAQSLLANNAELRERNMGRIASIVFDFSFHRRNTNNMHFPRSAFADPVAMEQLCGAVAANAVSTGPAALRHLVSDWIVPGIDSLAPLAVVAIMSHIAIEAMGKGCPAGTTNAIEALVPSVLKCAIGPILIDSLRESDERGDDAMVETSDDTSSMAGGGSIVQRTATLALRALDSWCKVDSIGSVKLRSIFSSSNINILEAIADALYSNAEIMIDAVSDLIETLLDHDANNANVSLGISIAGSVMNNCLPSGMANQLLLAQQMTGDNEKSRVSILTELVSAVGLQRFRFAERQSNGDTAVCRCLARTAAKILLESRDLIQNGTIKASGLFDLLFKAASHPSVYVCGIAVEALAVIAPSNSELSTRLLPNLQGKAIIPFHLIEDVGGSLDDYSNFRERVLVDALVACYTGCSAFYLESCGSAIEEFCQATPSPHLPYQLEAALFCMIAVSERVKKEPGKEALCIQLEKMVSALSKNSFSTTSHPLVMAKMCLFINKYATSISSCETKTVFETASELVFASFNRGLEEYNKKGQSSPVDGISPLSEASNAFKQLLCSSPTQFSTPAARSALENAWKMPYACQQMAIEDREMLCSGLCSVIISLPSEQWNASLDALAQPILSCLNVVTKEADQLFDIAGGTGPQENLVALMNRLSNEIRLLAAVVRCFIEAGASQSYYGENKEGVIACHRNALVTLLHKSWPCLKHIGEKYCSYEVIATSIGRLLKDTLSLYGSEEELPLLLEITGLAKTSLRVVAKAKDPSSLVPLLSFMQKFMYIHGSKIEPSPRNNAINETIQVTAKNLMLISYEAVRSCKSSQDSNVAQNVASPMFDTLSSCAKKCPIFLLGLSRDSQPVGEVISSSVETAPVTMKSNEMDIVLSSITFLKELVSSLASLSLEALGEDRKDSIVSVIENIKRVLQTDILITAITSTCAGISPREVLDPLSGLMRAIVSISQWSDIESSVSGGINCGQFQLGDEAKSVALQAFQKCTESEHVPANFRKLISDMWEMHQTDDVGNIAGGEAVLDFIQRYKSS
mmetsp:Transcript_14196/g.30254  ORF Transcript_14196/g.30254 Transcript_14196/m.30254 type:complete len:1153 (-) Transcript_14196:223-3681(-)